MPFGSVPVVAEEKTSLRFPFGRLRYSIRAIFMAATYVYVTYVQEDPSAYEAPMRARVLTHGHRIISILNPIDISRTTNSTVIIPPRLTTTPRTSTSLAFLPERLVRLVDS